MFEFITNGLFEEKNDSNNLELIENNDHHLVGLDSKKDEEEDEKYKHLSEIKKKMAKALFTKHWVTPDDKFRENILIGDAFEVLYLDRFGKKFDKVSRFEARSLFLNMELVLDFNSELININVGEQYHIAIAFNLSPDGKPVKDDPSTSEPPSWNNMAPTGLGDHFKYIMYGKVYRYEEKNEEEATVYVSFGGLLLSLTTTPNSLAEFNVNHYVYLLIDDYIPEDNKPRDEDDKVGGTKKSKRN
ncbi:hypothetical protein K502DRAFT_362204 [Neoconidiobolus thromboides FSU 785]|nr:hypothetical protein K502DRAFT_362204 [Neoconidiobolus thromboides FSU 785]